MYVGLSTIFTLCAQLLVLVTIIKSPELYNAHFYLLGVYCSVDIILVSLTGPVFIVFLSDGHVSNIVCQVIAVVVQSLALGLVGHTAAIACERYVFFCHSFRYLQQFSKARIVAAVVICYTIPVIVLMTPSMESGSTFHSSILSCTISDNTKPSAKLFALIVLPFAAVTIYCMIRVWCLSRSAGMGPGALGNQQTLTTPVHQARKTLKMILLLSGTFWATSLPAYVSWMTIFMAGNTWEDLDSRRYIGPSIVMRLTMFTHCFVSSAVNPLIYYYSRKDLRLATCKLLRLNRNTVQHDIEISEMN